MINQQGEHVPIDDAKLVPHIRRQYPQLKIYNDESNNRGTGPEPTTDGEDTASTAGTLGKDAGTLDKTGQASSLETETRKSLIEKLVEKGNNRTEVSRLRKADLIKELLK